METEIKALKERIAGLEIDKARLHVAIERAVGRFAVIVDTVNNRTATIMDRSATLRDLATAGDLATVGALVNVGDLASFAKFSLQGQIHLKENLGDKILRDLKEMAKTCVPCDPLDNCDHGPELSERAMEMLKEMGVEG